VDAGFPESAAVQAARDALETSVTSSWWVKVSYVTSDTCWYDLVADDEFILGAVPGADGLYTGVGWRGTGYKFAPWVGRVLAQLALQQGTVYDIGRFTPARFVAEGVAS
jgi:glycine/D-amino acid oxidase-like deaminating enzyme